MKKGVISLLLETHSINALREKGPALHRAGTTTTRRRVEGNMKMAGRLRGLTLEGKAGVETMIAQPPIARYSPDISWIRANLSSAANRLVFSISALTLASSTRLDMISQQAALLKTHPITNESTSMSVHQPAVRQKRTGQQSENRGGNHAACSSGWGECGMGIPFCPASSLI